MKDYFYDHVSRCFDNVIYRMYGPVAVALYSDDKDEMIKYVAYDIPNDVLLKLSNEEQKSHIKLEKTFDISGVDFNNKMNVLENINELVKAFELDISTK